MQLEKRLTAMEQVQVTRAAGPSGADELDERLRLIAGRLGEMPTEDEWYRHCSQIEVMAVVLHIARSPIPQGLDERFEEMSKLASPVGEWCRNIIEAAEKALEKQCG